MLLLPVSGLQFIIQSSDVTTVYKDRLTEQTKILISLSSLHTTTEVQVGMRAGQKGSEAGTSIEYEGGGVVGGGLQ